MTQIIIASHNKGKIPEIQKIVKELGLHVCSSSELGLNEPEETGETFEDNALLKARETFRELKKKDSSSWVLADDSGLCVDALEGRPGVYSGRWAEKTPGGPRDFSFAFDRLFKELEACLAPQEEGGYKAKMVCVIALISPEGKELCFRGEVEGMLQMPPRGEHGFGYDPIFTPLGSPYTFAQMLLEEKATLSHRSKALQLLWNYFHAL